MPLVWDATEVADWENVDGALRTSVDFMMMSVGINHITEENVREFWRRVNIVERLSGAFRTGREEGEDKMHDVLLSPEEARSLIGYKTNVSPMTAAKFKGHALNLHEGLVAAYKWPER